MKLLKTLCLSLSLIGCQNTPPVQPRPVAVPLRSAYNLICYGDTYQLEVVPVVYREGSLDAECVRETLKEWLEEHRDKRIISVTPVMHRERVGLIIHFVIVSV